MMFVFITKDRSKTMTDQNNEHPGEEEDPQGKSDAFYGEDLPDIKNPGEEQDPQGKSDAFYGEVGTSSSPDDDCDIESEGNT
jgi:hypothetical protein